MSNLETHIANFRDRMMAVRHTLTNANLPITALIAAAGHFDQAIIAAQTDAPTPPDDSEVVAVVKRYLLARALAPGDQKHGAPMEELRESLAALQTLVGFDPRAPFGTPETGSKWTTKHGVVYTVQGTYRMDRHDYVAATNATHGGLLHRVADWHLHLKPVSTNPKE